MRHIAAEAQGVGCAGTLTSSAAASASFPLIVSCSICRDTVNLLFVTFRDCACRSVAEQGSCWHLLTILIIPNPALFEEQMLQLCAHE